MTSDANALVEDGIRAYRAGEKERARELLQQATDIDSENEKGWMWLSAVVESDEERRICLENVLYINPNNENATRGLSKLNRPKTGQLKKQTDTLEQKAEPEQPTSASPFVVPPTATSSASAIYDPSNEPSTDVYDQWIGDLGIGQGSDSGSASPFISQDDPRDLLGTSEFANIFADAFSDDDFDDMETGASVDTPSRAVPTNAREDLFTDDPFDDMGDNDLFSGGPFTSDGFDTGLDEREPTPKSSTSPKSPIPKSPSKSSRNNDLTDFSGGDFYAGDSSISSSEELDPSLLFRRIPQQIKPTRVPGTNEKYPALVVIGLLTLIALNIGAIGFLVVNSS
jgi:hypothetical protein